MTTASKDMETTAVEKAFSPAALKRVSWGAIFAGTIVALAIQILFTLLGISIGAATIDPLQKDSGLSGFGAVSGFWTALGALFALFAGGWVAGRLAGIPAKLEGSIHGVAVWAFATILTAYFMTTAAGQLMNFATGVLGTGLNLAGKGISTSANWMSNVVLPNTQRIKSQARRFLRQMDISQDTIDDYMQTARQRLGEAMVDVAANPEDAYSEIEDAFVDLAQRAQGISQRIDEQDVVNLIVRNTPASRREARQIIDRWTRYANRQEWSPSEDYWKPVAKLGDKIAGTISSAAAWSFIAILIGLIAAAGGGFLGSPHKPLMTLPQVSPETPPQSPSSLIH